MKINLLAVAAVLIGLTSCTFGSAGISDTDRLAQSNQPVSKKPEVSSIGNTQSANWIKSGKNTGEDGATELIEFSSGSIKRINNPEISADVAVTIRQTWEKAEAKQVNLWLAQIDCETGVTFAIASVADIENSAIFYQESVPLNGGIYQAGIETICKNHNQPSP